MEKSYLTIALGLALTIQDREAWVGRKLVKKKRKEISMNLIEKRKEMGK